jgi:PadR family transcriptional regulator, regulatory protein AphA
MQKIEKPDGERQKPRTTTSFAILGLLSLRTWSTYELAKQVSRSLHWFWPRAERKLYDEPKALVADGLATASKSYTGERPRTVYEITDAGRAALTAWLDEPPAARVIEFEAMLKIFFADAGSIAQLVTTIGAVETSSRERLGELTAMIDAITTHPEFPDRLHISALSLRLQFAQEAGALKWSQWARKEVESWQSTTDPGRWDPRAALTALTADIHEALQSERGRGVPDGRHGTR